MLNDLEAELSKLYPTQAHARRVADYAGIPSVFVDFEEPVAIIWHQLVTQANARQLLGQLVAAALNDFPKSTVLQQVHGSLRYAQPASHGAMNERWGGLSETDVRLRERISVLETHMPRIDYQLRQLGEGQIANREWTDQKFSELMWLVRAAIVVGGSVTIILAFVLVYWFVVG